SKGLIALSACLKGRVATDIIANGVDLAMRTAGEYSEIFGKDNFYLELNYPSYSSVFNRCAFYSFGSFTYKSYRV
ncbi:MAG TPA: hypothetical protein PKI73_03470, partial [Petrotogaceae bacterium]|nr:hypothetical protein [Petrotogaceae bacterium]